MIIKIFALMFIIYELYKIFISKRYAGIVLALNEFRQCNWGHNPPLNFYEEHNAKKLMRAMELIDLFYYVYITYLLFTPLYALVGIVIWLQVVVEYLVTVLLHKFDKETLKNYQISVVIDSVISIAFMLIFILLK